jgi:hydrogenase maturation protease
MISGKFERGCAVTLRCELGDDVGGSSDEGAFVAARTPQKASTSLVLGFGNVLLSDDGAGVQLVERLRADLMPCGAQFIDAGTLSFSLLSYIEMTDSMLVIDAADIDGAPGAISLVEGAAMDAFLKSTRRRTVHEVGLIDLLDMARLQGCLPPRRALLCIQPGRIDWSESLSPPVAEALPEAARQAKALLCRWQVV